MKVAVIGSRKLDIDMIDIYIPAAATEIVSGGAKGVDSEAKSFAIERKLKYTEFLPDYKKYGKAAPLKRNDEIIEYADIVIALWDEKSKGTKYVIDKCKEIGKSLIVYHHSFCEEINLPEIDNCEYFNLTALSHEMLKEIIVKELDGETQDDINLELISASVIAIYKNKYQSLLEYLVKKNVVKDLKELEKFLSQKKQGC